MRATCPARLILLDLIILIIYGERVQVMKLLIMQLSPASCHFIPLGPNILLGTLFSSTLSLCSSLNVRDQVLHPYRSTGKTTILGYDTKSYIRWMSPYQTNLLPTSSRLYPEARNVRFAPKVAIYDTTVSPTD
jgi:hypothetical protein